MRSRKEIFPFFGAHFKQELKSSEINKKAFDSTVEVDKRLLLLSRLLVLQKGKRALKIFSTRLEY